MFYIYAEIVRPEDGGPGRRAGMWRRTRNRADINNRELYSAIVDVAYM